MVFPAPFWPRMPQRAPWGTLRSKSFSAVFSLFRSHPETKVFRKPFTSMANFTAIPFSSHRVNPRVQKHRIKLISCQSHVNTRIHRQPMENSLFLGQCGGFRKSWRSTSEGCGALYWSRARWDYPRFLPHNLHCPGVICFDLLVGQSAGAFFCQTLRQPLELRCWFYLRKCLGCRISDLCVFILQSGNQRFYCAGILNLSQGLGCPTSDIRVFILQGGN